MRKNQTNKPVRKSRHPGRHIPRAHTAHRRPPATPPVQSPPVFTFAQILAHTASESGTLATNLPLAAYADELRIKSAAFAAFLAAHGIKTVPEGPIPSPLPRHYRTTSKRRVVRSGRSLKLLSPGESEHAVLLEPAEHELIYSRVAQALQHPPFTPLVRELNHIIIRGTYDERVIILNVAALSGPVVQQARNLCNTLLQADSRLVGAFLYLDPTRSDYYLEARRPDEAVTYKRLFGHDRFRLRIEWLTFQIEPTSFSQVNQSMLPQLVRVVREMLPPGGDARLIDLYCGYGLFSYALGTRYRESIGIDAAKPSIASAIGAQKHNPHPPVMRFLVRMISARTLEECLPPAGDTPEDVILDPPKNGCDPQVVACVAARNPRRVVHIFCGTDEIPGSLAAWDHAGYKAVRIVALDMFAGTANLETVVLLERG